MRLQVEVDITKPHFVGFSQKMKGFYELWVQIKFERLPSICYGCGIINHEKKMCQDLVKMAFFRQKGMQ